MTGASSIMKFSGALIGESMLRQYIPTPQKRACLRQCTGVSVVRKVILWQKNSSFWQTQHNQNMLTILKALSHGHLESSIGSMPVSFLMALPGIIAVGEFDMIRYWLSSDSFSTGCEQKKEELWLHLTHLNFIPLRQKLEMRTQCDISNWPEEVVLTNSALTWDSVI